MTVDFGATAASPVHSPPRAGCCDSIAQQRGSRAFGDFYIAFPSYRSTVALSNPGGYDANQIRAGFLRAYIVDSREQ
jgi:hypothetical protein